jgi:ribosome-associated protein
MSEDPTIPSGSSAETAKIIARVCDETKAVDINVVDMTGRSSLADFFIVCTGNSEPHLRAIADHVREVLIKQGRYPLNTDGAAGNQWVVQDYGSVILHILNPDTRRYYNLESLWRSSRDDQPSTWLCPDSEILSDEPMGRRPPPKRPGAR